MDTITKETYREYLSTRVRQLTEHLMHLPAGDSTLKLHLEIQRDMDYIMQQLYLLDNEQEED